MSDGGEGDRLRRLIALGRSLVSELDLETLLSQVLDAARELTGARYAALGVLDERRRVLDRFLTRGIDAEARRAIGDPPQSRGILELLVAAPRPLRLDDLREHLRSGGIPANHPPMRSFLGVPIAMRGEAWGSLYVTDKEGGDFDLADEQSVMTLAAWGAVAIQHASLSQRLEGRAHALERALRTLEATTAIARAVGAETESDRVLELIVERGRTLVDARAMVILLRDEDDLSVVACAGEVDASVIGRRIPVEASTSGTVLQVARPERIHDVASRLRMASDWLGVRDAHTALLVPLAFRSRRLGVFAAFDRIGGELEFGAEHEALLSAFAASAATAVATAQWVERRRLRESIEAAEQERRRWARELHDETLQGLGSFQVLLSSALRRGRPADLEQAVRSALEQIDVEIGKLRMLIADLRPAALDELGLQPAIEGLASHAAAVEGIEVETDVRLGDDPTAPVQLGSELETTIYRLVQEALTNVVKHADARRVSIEIAALGDDVLVTVRDDGTGFEPERPRAGFGITGMQERVGLSNGTLAIASAPGRGTTVQARLRAASGTRAPRVAERQRASSQPLQAPDRSISPWSSA